MRVVSGWDICSRPGRVPDGGGLRGQGGLETGCGDMVWSSLVYAALHVIQCRIVDPASDGQLLDGLERGKYGTTGRCLHGYAIGLSLATIRQNLVKGLSSAVEAV